MSAEPPNQSRVTLYLKGISSAYVLLTVNICYSFVSIPFVLHFLGKETFGLWSLTVQIGAVLQLADAGMGGALVRILIDYKDEKKSPAYRQTLYSVWLSLVVIGILLSLFLWIANAQIIQILNVKPSDQVDYSFFLLIFCLVFSFGFCLRPINLVLSAHQRNDLVNWTSAIGLFTGFVVLIACLLLNLGLWSLLYSQISVMMASSTINFLQARKLNYLPVPNLGDFFVWHRLIEVGHYGWQRLLAIIGGTMLSTAPTFLITRYLGLESTATWTIGTRVLQLMEQITVRLPELAFPGFVEMRVRGEILLLKQRFLEIFVISLSCASAFSGILLSSNQIFVQLWTNSKILWAHNLDFALALFLPVLIARKTLWYPASIAKNLGLTKYILIVEAALFVLIIMLFSSHYLSLSVVAWALFTSSALVSLPCFFYRAAVILEMPVQDLAKSAFNVFLRIFAPVIIISYILASVDIANTWINFLIKTTVVSLLIFALLLTFGNFINPILKILLKIKSQ